MVMGEVEIFLDEVEKIFWWKFGEENGRMEKVGEFGGKKKEGKKKEKGKENEKRRYSLGRKVKKIIVADSRDSVADAENFRKNTEIVPKSSISERLAKIIKNQEYYFKTHGEIRFKKYFIVLKLKISESVTYRLRRNFHKIIKSSEKGI